MNQSASTAGIGDWDAAVDAAFGAYVREVAEVGAPRLFAVVEEIGDRSDARVVGYGLEYADRAESAAVGGGVRMSSEDAEGARQLFEITGGNRAHLVWVGGPAEVVGEDG
ncbi:hypothetical protein KCV87_25330 [Actinosynnema pretiosum subsp. pretiosum]|uniref:Uncharacterized protein n=2 Tax=Actinosynnema TaxID=40566 RepID=C6WHH8_ACTMD|nr:hypothetical protein [Actinosynnema mirum]ACU39927.1 hypothetical protein Amir_6120 [Actinosynnema mirum DSM 43827]AXX33441.1 hypothetical protein APASM_6076 [Actinosynnema pretiosum subsp. pretiosum]QUF02752.1 hypothetical protein KCV87_25330 [Actinosynnema pretiosum subsp. pretiosum]